VRRWTGVTGGQITAWPLTGHKSAQAAFLSAHKSGKLHHGWMLEGPSGIGKSQLARKIAAYILGADCAPDTLDCAVDDPVAQKLLAGAHPDLRWLSREPDEKGKIKQDIPVDAVRELNAFFALKPALGGWRIGVIDSIDELNRAGANAILKTLEEPPANCLLLLISHRTRAVLPTIRSRCRMLRLTALSEDDTRQVLDSSDHENARESTTRMLARGRPGHGLKLASKTGIAAANATRTFLRGMPKPSDAAIGDVISCSRIDDVAFEAFSSEVLAWLSEKSENKTAYAKAWLEAARLIGEARELNMDRMQVTAQLIARLQKSGQSG